MKTDAFELEPARVEETRASIYPIELVANIAAKVLIGTDYIKAAKTAMALLDACQKELQEQNLRREIVCTAQEKRKSRYAAVERDRSGAFAIKAFKKALKEITGEGREERAFPKYKRFLTHQIHASRVNSKEPGVIKVVAPTDEEVENAIKEYKGSGMRHDVVLGQQAAFEVWNKKDASEIATRKALGKSTSAK